MAVCCVVGCERKYKRNDKDNNPKFYSFIAESYPKGMYRLIQCTSHSYRNQMYSILQKNPNGDFFVLSHLSIFRETVFGFFT
jgi:hypothetical protein